MKPSEFLTALWGTTPPGRVALWRMADRKSLYPPYLAGADAHIGKPDVFTAVALTHDRRAGQGGRPGARDAQAIAGMWLDIDISEHHAADLDSALALASSYLPPTLIVHSGHGIHAWHLLDQPWRFRDLAEQADGAHVAQAWQAVHRAAAGHRLDATHDLARILRLPGTVNAKREPHIPVKALVHDGPRYDLDAIRRIASEAGALPAWDTGSPTAVSAIDTGGGGTDIEVILDADPHIHAAFHHIGGRPEWTLSEWDMSLARRLGMATHEGRPAFTDQQIADVLIAHREHHAAGAPKQRRGDYLRRTIARGREPSRQEKALATLRELRHTPRQEAPA